MKLTMQPSDCVDRVILALVRNGDVEGARAYIREHKDPFQEFYDDEDEIRVQSFFADVPDLAAHGRSLQASLLTMAVMDQNMDMAHMLIEEGAMIKTWYRDVEAGKQVPVHAAIVHNDLATVKLLIESGADPYACLYGTTSIQTACDLKRLEILRWLLEDVGLDAGIAFKDCIPPLARMLDTGDPDIAVLRLLLAHGASPLEHRLHRSVDGCHDFFDHLWFIEKGDFSPEVLTVLLSSTAREIPTRSWLDEVERFIRQEADPAHIFDILSVQRRLMPYHKAYIRAIGVEQRESRPENANAIDRALFHVERDPRRTLLLHRTARRASTLAARRRQTAPRANAASASMGGIKRLRDADAEPTTCVSQSQKPQHCCAVPLEPAEQ